MTICRDKNKFLTAEASSKAALRTQGAIDKFLNITNLQKFRELNRIWSDYAKTNYGITERLFLEDGTKVVPNTKSFKKIDKAKGINYQIEGVPSSSAAQPTIDIVKKAAVNMGINIQGLTEYARETGLDTTTINGVADLARGVIALSEGREGTTLTEEVVHIASAMIEQTTPKLITELISKIDRFKIFKIVLEAYKGNKNYQLVNGKPDIRKIKMEAVDKLIAEVIINNSENKTDFPELLQEEDRNMVQRWWDTIKDYIRGIYRKTNIDIFNTAAETITEGSLGNVKDIKSNDVFYQLKHDMVDKFYNTVIDYDARLEIPPVTLTDPRHYMFDTIKRVATSVTEKIKGKNKMPERTPIQKISDEQKKDWGLGGHDYMENYINVNLIDKDGYALDVPKNEPIDSQLSPVITEKLREFAKKLISSYAPGTRFLIERKIINTEEKGLLASTIDFKAIEPVTINGKPDIRIDTLDWKFTSIDKTIEDDVPWYKQTEWVGQMGEYVKIDRLYGATAAQIRKARMIPFILNYKYYKENDPKSGLYPSSIEIGELDALKETKLYLLPVPTSIESTGNKDVDELIASLTEYYERLINKPVSFEEKDIKKAQLNEISKAIRTLRMKLDFSRLYNVGDTFLRNADITFKKLENIDYNKLTESEISDNLRDLLEIKNSANKFTSIDSVFLGAFPKESLDKVGRETLTRLEKLSSATERMIDKVIEFQRIYAIYKAAKEKITEEEILAPEKEIKALMGAVTEPSKLDSKIINLGTKLLNDARSNVNIKMGKLFNEYSKVLLPLEKLAKSQGKSAFDYIGTANDSRLSLIKKVDKAFWEKLSEEKLKKNKQFLLDNLNLDEYNNLTKPFIEKSIEELKITYSADEESVVAKRDYEIKRLKNSLDIESKEFNGYDSGRFAYFYGRTMRSELHYSEEYKKLITTPEAFDVWKFLTGLNDRGISNGYLSYKGSSFFALVEASMLQKLAATDNMIQESGDMFKDLYKVRINEEHEYSKIDPETRQARRNIPKLHTRTDKEVHQLSRDLTKVGTIWIKTLLEYEMARHLEMSMLTLLSVERAKGHIVVDENNRPISVNGELKIDLSSNKNADMFQTIIDDDIYGLHEDLSSIGGKSIGMIAEKLSKDSEAANNKVLSVKKGMENLNLLTQALAVGAKASIAIPNYFGNHFQAYINSGHLYTYSDFFNNHLKMITGIGLTTKQKGLLDMIVPLNGDPSLEVRRKIAFEQGYVKWLGAWNMQEAMMASNYLPERNLQFTNALSIIDNTIVIDGKIINANHYLKEQDQFRYTELSESERRIYEKGSKDRLKKLLEDHSLEKATTFENDQTVISNVSDEEIVRFRTLIVENGRNLNGQMSQENKAGYRRDVMLKSLAMFRNWIPKQISVRAHDIRRNLETDEWEYGRTRAFMKTWVHLGFASTFRMIDIIRGTDKGLAIMNDMLDKKRKEYYLQHGQVLNITTEDYYDLMRQELVKEMKELGMLVGLITVVLAAKAAKPDKDADLLTQNKYKYWARIMNKISNEVDFYYDPTSFVTMTKGNFLPALGLAIKAQRAIYALGDEAYGNITGNQSMINKTHPVKYFLDMIPLTSQFDREILPLIAPDLARSMGIRIMTQPRIQQ